MKSGSLFIDSLDLFIEFALSFLVVVWKDDIEEVGGLNGMKLV
jgi:hypothetical protein